MSTNIKPKAVNYRRCVAEAPADGNPKSFDLQKLLKDASAINSKPWIRKISAGGDKVQFLAHLVPKQGCVCGALVIYENNRLVPLIDAETDGSTWEGAVEPQDSTGKKRKLQEQVLCFAIRENHVAVIQSKELDIRDLQDFLVWFIQSEAKLADGWLFILQNLPSLGAVEKLKDHKVKRVQIGADAFSAIKTEIPNPDPKSTSKRKHYSTTIETDPLLLSILKAFIKDDAIIDEMTKSSDPGSIHVELDISYRSRTEKDSQRVMRTLASVVGDNPDLDTTIFLDGDQKITNEELTIRGKVDVQCPGNNISSDDAMSRIAEWLLEKIKDKKTIP